MSTIILNLSPKKKSNKMQIHSPIIPRFTTREFPTRFYRRRESLNHPRIKLYTFPLDEKMQFVVRREIIQGGVVASISSGKAGCFRLSVNFSGQKNKNKTARVEFVREPRRRRRRVSTRRMIALAAILVAQVWPTGFQNFNVSAI